MPLEKIIPTVGLNLLRMERRNGEYIFWDLGGQSVLRKIWNKYFNEASCIVFMIDGTDSHRFPEVLETLNELYSSPESELASKPLLFVLNK